MARGFSIPTRQGWPGAGSPNTAMSPPALIIAAGAPAILSSSRARSTAQPLTSPVGSTPPGIAHGSNHPSEASRARRHSSSTSATSGGVSSSPISPRRSRLTGLSCFQVLNTSSTHCSLAWARSTP